MERTESTTMIDIDRIHNDIAKLYLPAEEQKVDVPLQLQAIEFARYARSYIEATETLVACAPLRLLPRLQLTGQAIELALKACLASARIIPPLTHDLVQLCRKALAHGFGMTETEAALIVHVHHAYYADLQTGTKFKSRYPAQALEGAGGVLPPHEGVQALVESLSQQAVDRADYN